MKQRRTMFACLFVGMLLLAMSVPAFADLTIPGTGAIKEVTITDFSKYYEIDMYLNAAAVAGNSYSILLSQENSISFYALASTASVGSNTVALGGIFKVDGTKTKTINSLFDYTNSLTHFVWFVKNNKFDIDTSGGSGTDIIEALAKDSTGKIIGDAKATPIPTAAWLLGSGLLGLIGVRRRNA